ncbi:hypothetical protein [Mycolicibacterium sp. A43C]
MADHELSVDELAKLIGDRIPTGTVPAAWWITTDPDQLAAYDRWIADYDARREDIKRLADTLGVDVTDARTWHGFGSTSLLGFTPPPYMGHWNTELPEHRPIPDGWRIDKKKNLLVPSRRTKADRDSQANRDFNAVARIPHLTKYLTGMAGEIEIDHPGGGRIYFTGYTRGEQCVLALSGGDPDRQSGERRKAEIDTSIWHRQRVATLVALREARS